MGERYVATSAAGERVVRTDDPALAAEWAARLRGEVVDLAAEEEQLVLEGLEFDVECQTPVAAHPAEFSLTCRSCRHTVFACGVHVEEARRDYRVGVVHKTCGSRGPHLDAVFAVQPLSGGAR